MTNASNARQDDNLPSRTRRSITKPNGASRDVEVRRASPVLPYDDIPPELAETIRGIINRHELRTGGALPHTVAVAAAGVDEGVTTVSQAWAAIVAQELGSFVCWVDFSWLDPDAPEPPTPRPNVIEILADNSRLKDAFISDPELPQLVSLWPGRLPEASRNRVVRTPEFEHLLDLLDEEFDHVVFDVPPLLANANSLAVVRLADASLLVARHRRTTVGDIRRATEAMESTPNLAVVLNRFQTRAPSLLRRLLGE